jgi:spore maturation protein CgeB
MSLKLLKFDTINPENYLKSKIDADPQRFKNMKRKEFLDYMISLRSNFSDFYTYNLNKLGWQAEEFFITKYYLDKVADELYGSRKNLLKAGEEIKNRVRPFKKRWILKVLMDYISDFKPDVILVRELVGIPSEFWRTYSGKILLVSRIATPVPRYWSVSDWDLILTSTEAFRTFFELNGVESVINPNGFDSRILNELNDTEKEYDVSFVGGLGDRFWKKRTECVNYFADKINFRWWGFCGNKYPADHPLIKSNMGITSGLEMLEIYKKSRIIFNDYGEIADKVGVNQRIFEVLGVGTLLLTREAENLKKQFPENIFVTFKDEKDCLDKINYYLKNEKEREEIASAGQKFILENYRYEYLMKDLDKILMNSFNRKFCK